MFFLDQKILAMLPAFHLSLLAFNDVLLPERLAIRQFAICHALNSIGNEATLGSNCPQRPPTLLSEF